MKNPHLILSEAVKEPLKLPLQLCTCNRKCYSLSPSNLRLVMQLLGRPGCRLEEMWTLLWEPHTLLSSPRAGESTLPGYHFINCCCKMPSSLRHISPSPHGTKGVLFGCHDWYKLQSAHKPEEDRKERRDCRGAKIPNNILNRLTCLPDAGHLGSYGWGWDVGMWVYVYEVQWESGISRGVGQEGKVGYKSRTFLWAGRDYAFQGAYANVWLKFKCR